MRSALLPLIAVLSFATTPTGAQPVVRAGAGKVVTGPSSLPSVEPLSHNASNTSGADTRSVIAPALAANDTQQAATIVEQKIPMAHPSGRRDDSMSR
ncbi:MAG TPA: hypothetical protein VMB73_21660 [Acetobacteraceae bacterium]|nr:hypothetical protein [Acetobacteraceae bacterium]